MKIYASILSAICLALTAQAEQVEMVKVTGDRVSMRTRPDTTNSEVLDRAMQGTEMEYLGETNGWVAVQAPDTLNLWAHKDHVENGKIKPSKLNVRSGPSQNYDVMVVMTRGDAVSVRGEFNEWLKIAPPPGTKVWISADYVERTSPAAKVAKEEPHQAEELKPLVLKEDKTKPQGAYTEIGGVLKRANPGLYKLVEIDNNGNQIKLCLVRGNEKQLEGLLNRSVLIKGKLYFALNVTEPIIQPTVIVPSPIIQTR